MTTAALIYPHQLFAEHPALQDVSQVVLVEEPLFFTQYRFHRQKLILHRATMMGFAERRRQRSQKVQYISSKQMERTSDIAGILKRLGIDSVRYVDPCDDWLSTRLSAALKEQSIQEKVLEDPHFLTPTSEIEDYTAGKRKLFFTKFYIAQRNRLGVLLENDGEPVGGKWSFDPENRKKLPKAIRVPDTPCVAETESIRQARQYVRRNFPDAVGTDAEFNYPTDHETAATWLAEFVHQRLASFGDYEDSISEKHEVLFHSVLTPMLNIGLLSPHQVLDAALAQAGQIPLNSLEGFVRQVIGWREFVRLVYLTLGRQQRSQNFWGFTQEIPRAFYEASTGIEPVDHVIRKVLRTGYCHHIERLMILGNFLLLCEVHPDAVYRWFMELFIDAYDWVMVPNVYGMSQYADGGLMTTKPYLSGSSYVRKMSDFKRGPWCDVWDALYWRFVDRHVNFFAGNPRLAVMASMRKRIGHRMEEHHRVAGEFLTRFYGR